MNDYIVIYVVPVLIAAALLFMVPKIKQRKGTAKREQNPDAAVDGETGRVFEPVQAIIYDNDTREFYPETLPAAVVQEIIQEHGTLGRIVNDDDDGRDYYSVCKEGRTYTPVSIPQTLDQPPDKLYIPFLIHYVIDLALPNTEGKGLLEKYGPIIWVGVLSIAVMFLLVAGK